ELRVLPARLTAGPEPGSPPGVGPEGTDPGVGGGQDVGAAGTPGHHSSGRSAEDVLFVVVTENGDSFPGQGPFPELHPLGGSGHQGPGARVGQIGTCE